MAAVSSGNTSLAIGRQSAATNDYAQAIGNVSAATGKGTLAIGHSATATGYRAIAIGSPDIENAGSSGSGQVGTNYQTVGQTKATAKDSIAFGGGAQATAENALSIGAFSEASAEKSVAIGTGAKATAANAVVIGEGANTAVAGGVALGLNAQVTGINSAAVGKDSIALAQTGASFLTNIAATTQGTVSFGNSTEKRRLTNLADGAVASDAVTVAQLQKQNDLTNKQGVDTAAALGGASTYNPSTGAVTTPIYNVGGANVNSVGAAITNIDTRTTANNTSITTLQNQTFKIKANADTASSVGANDTITFNGGSNINISRTGNNITIATSSTPTFDSITSTGAINAGGALTVTGSANLNGGANLNNKKITGLANGTDANDAVNKSQLDAVIAAGGTDVRTDALGQSTAANLGGGATYSSTTGAVSAPTYTLNNGNNTPATTAYDNVGDALGNLDGRTTTNTTNIATNTGDIASLTNGTAGLVQQANGTAPITVAATTGGTSVNFTGADGNRQLTSVASAGDYTLATNQTNAVNAGDLNTAVTSLSDAGLKFSGDSTTALTRKLGEELKLRGGATAADLSDNNIGIVANGTDTLTIKLSRTLTGLTSAQYVDALNPANVSTITAAGTNVTNGANTSNYGANGFTATDAAGNNGINVNNGGVSFTDNLGAATGPVITAAGINAGNKKITGLIDGTLATDAATVGQVDALGDSAVQYDRNQNGSVNKNSVSLKGITATSTQATNGRIITTAGTSLNNVASAGDYTNVANASKGINAGDLNNAVLDASGNVQNIIGGSTTVNADGSITNNNIGGTGATTVDGAITNLATGKAGLVQQANGTAPITVGKDSLGAQVNFINANGIDRQLTGVASAGDISVAANANNATNAGDLNTAITGVTNKGFALQAADGTKVQKALGDAVEVIGSNSNVTTQVNNGKVEIALNNDLVVDSITADDGAGNVTNLTAAGTNVTDGTSTANYGAANATVTNGANVTTIAAGNVSVSGVNNTDPLNPVTNTIVLNGTTGQINGLTDGTLATDAATVGQVDAATNAGNTKTDELGQSTAANLGGNAAYDSTTGAVSAPTYTLNDGNNTAATTDYDSVGDALGNLDVRTTTNTSDIDDLATGKAGLVQQANGTAPITVGKDSLGTQVNFTNTNGIDRQLTGVASGNVSATSTDAINGGQIYGLVGANAYKDASGNTTSSIQNIGGTGTTNINDAIASVSSATTKAKTTVSEGDNIVITTTTNTDGSTDYEVATSKNLAVDSITADDGAGNVTNLTATGTNVTNGANTSNYGANGFTATDAAGNNGITVNNSGVSFTDNLGAATGPRFTAGGIDAGDTAIINVADAVNATDAVNKGQLDNLADGSVQYARNQNGSVNYNQVTLAGTPAVLGVNADGKSIVVSGGTTLSNVANGAIASDAVNKGQLDSAISANITDVVVTDANGNPITVNVTEQVVNTNLNNDPNSLFLTYNVEGQNFTDRLTIGETVQKMNTEGVKFAHTNAVAAPLAGASTNDSSAGGDNSTAIGVNAIITQNGESSVALGHNTRVEGASSIAIGNGSQANGNQSIAIGTGNIVNGNNSGAFGDPNTINGNDSYAVGNNNTINSNDTFVLGNDVTATVDGSVVLGTGSGATTGAGVAGYGSVGNAAIIATTSTTGAVAVGNGTNVFRQITGLAAGTQDSDAVNVAQLKAVDNALTNLTNGGAGLVQQAGNNAVITVGAATGGTSVNFAGTDGDRQLIGVAAGTAINHAANVGQITSALGNQATVGADGKINANLNVGGTSYGNVQDALSAVNGQVGQLSDAAVQYDKNPDSTVNKGKITLGGGVNGTTLTNVKDGVLSAGSKDAVNGGQLFETNQQVNNLANQISSGSVGLVQQAGDKAQVTVAANTGGTSVSMAGTDGNRTVTGVKAGAVNATSNEAVNGAQLHAANSNVASALGGGSKVDADGNVTAPAYDVAGSTYNNVGSALQAVDNASTTRFDALNNKFDQAFYYTNDRINKVEKQANAGIAAALSLESAPFVPGKFTYSVGAGFHGGENAVGATLRRTSDSGRWSLTGGVAAASEGGASARVGISGIID